MAKSARGTKRSRRSVDEQTNVLAFPASRRQRGVGKTHEGIRRVECRTEAQGQFLLAIKHHVIAFGIGPAGTGKSHIPTAYGAELLQTGEIDTIIITRPMEGGDEEEMGALPGTLEEKFEPWFGPIRAILDKQMGKNAVDCQIKLGNIVVKPLQFLRGSTFENALVILDEAQNTTPKQMELFLTRIGNNCRVIINGDLAQQDTAGVSGFRDAILKLHPLQSRDISFSVFTTKDIVRHDVVRQVLGAYRKKLSAADARLMKMLQGDVEADDDE